MITSDICVLLHTCRSAVWLVKMENWKVFDLSQQVTWLSIFTAIQVENSMEIIKSVGTILHVNPGARLHMEIWSFWHGMVGPVAVCLTDSCLDPMECTSVVWHLTLVSTVLEAVFMADILMVLPCTHHWAVFTVHCSSSCRCIISLTTSLWMSGVTCLHEW